VQAVALASVFAVRCARTAFIGHDAGHAQISGNRATNHRIGLIHGILLLGMSYAWWNHKHNRHHANPNHRDKDPDVAADVLVFTSEQAATRTGFRGWLTRHQAWLFFLTLLEGLALKLHGFQDLRRRTGRERLVEGTLLVAHVAGYVALLPDLVDSYRQALRHMRENRCVPTHMRSRRLAPLRRSRRLAPLRTPSRPT
jgi:fatty acid desaturase